MSILEGSIYCPDCQSVLVPYFIKNKYGREVTIYYCYSCGGYWCEHWVANYISYKEFLQLEKQLPLYEEAVVISGNGKCPFCQIKLQRLIGENIPPKLSVYVCPQCFGNWFPRGEFSRFKMAQEEKLEYLKKYNLPLKSIYQVLLPVIFLFFTALMIPLTTWLVQTKKEERGMAREYIQNIQQIKVNEQEVIISFKTDRPLISELVLIEEDKADNYLISSQPLTYHQIKITTLEEGRKYKFKILLKLNGKVIETNLMEINLK